MTWTLVAHGQPPTGNPPQTVTLNTTGADLIVIGVSDFAGGSTPTDNQSNTYTVAITGSTSRQTPKIFSLHNPTVSSSHTFTANGNAGYIDIQAWSGSGTGTVLDQTSQTKSGALGATTVTTLSVTPTQSNELCVVFFSYDDPSISTAITLNNSFTVSDQGNEIAGSAFGSCMGYFVQSAAAAITCTATRPNAGTNSAGQDGALIATFKGASATLFFGWLPSFDKERPGLLAKQADDRQQFFLKPAAAASTAPVLWKTGDGGERPILLRRNDDGAPFFLPQKQPLWLPQLHGGERPKRIDPAPEQVPFFKPAAPAIYVPRSDGGERPSRPQDQSIAVFQVQPPATTPSTISGMAWYLPQEGMRPPGPKDQYGLTWDPQSIAAAVSITKWLPTAGDTDLRLPPPRRLDEAATFVAIAAAIPSLGGWKTGDGNERPVIMRRPDDPAGFFVAPKPITTPNIFWFVPYDQPPRIVQPDVSALAFALKPPPPAVGISGMSWWRQIEELVGPPPPQLDYHPGWDPQFVQQVNPPPGPSQQFTVSGFGVSLTFTEFFVDVVLTDAPITRRTN